MGQRMMYFRPNPELLDERFMVLSIYGPMTRTYVELTTNGSTVRHLRLGQVNALPILWCPLNEQRLIVAHVKSETAPLEEARKSADREIALLREYRTRLIADVVTGKLDVREAAARLSDEAEDPEPFDEVQTKADLAEVTVEDVGADAEEIGT